MSGSGLLSTSDEADPSADVHARRLAAEDAFLAEYEVPHGEITLEEMNAAALRARGPRANHPEGPANAE